jgi:hypothetical protein
VNTDLYMTTKQLAEVLCLPGRVKRHDESAIQWARARHIAVGDGGRTKLFLKADVFEAIHGRTRRPRLRKVS